MPNMYVDSAESKTVILGHINALREDKKLIDIVLIAARDDKKVAAHRLLLSSRSEYFSNIFSSSLPEYKRLEIPINNVFGKDLLNIIQYCYTGIIELGNDNAEAILATACLFKLTDLIKTCQTFMSDKMSAANCLGLWTVAEKYNCRNLLVQARSYACDHFADVSKSQEFLRLDNGRLRELIGRGELSGTTEDEILLSLIRWLQHERHERAQFASGLVSLIRVPLLSAAFVVEHQDFIVDSIEDKTFINEIFKWHSIPIEKRPEIYGNAIKVHNSTVETLLAVMLDNRNGGKIQKYSQQNDEWTTWTKIEQKQNRSAFGVAVIDDELIIAGGWGDSLFQAFNTVISTNLKTKISKPLNPMATCRACVSLAVLNKNVYAIGGCHTHFNWLKSVERLNYDTGEWKNIAPMIENKSRPRAAVLNDYIYVIGSDTKTLECYDPLTNKWTLRAPMHEIHDRPGVAVLNDHLYVIGGFVSKTVERYHYESNTWTKICSLSNPRSKFGCIAMKDRIFAVGGLNIGEYLSTVEEYDPFDNVWTRKANFNAKGYCNLVLAKGIP